MYDAQSARNGLSGLMGPYFQWHPTESNFVTVQTYWQPIYSVGYPSLWSSWKNREQITKVYGAYSFVIQTLLPVWRQNFIFLFSYTLCSHKSNSVFLMVDGTYQFCFKSYFKKERQRQRETEGDFAFFCQIINKFNYQSNPLEYKVHLNNSQNQDSIWNKTKMNWLMLLMQKITVYSENTTKPTAGKM